MASKSDLLKNLSQHISLFDQSLLETISSKGLVRRAQKDLESIEPEIEGEEGTFLRLRVVDAFVKINEQGPTKAFCSCPSKEVCRHILIACLWLSKISKTENQLSNETAGESRESPEKSQNKEISYNDLVGWAGKKLVNLAFEKIANGEEVKIVKERIVTVTIPTVNITCRFYSSLQESREKFLESGICSCRSSSLCIHLVVAAIVYFRNLGNTLESEEMELLKASAQTPRSRNEVIASAKILIEKSIEIGICNLSEIKQERFATLAVSATGVNLPRLSAEVRVIGEQIGLALAKDAKADQYKLLQSMTRTYALCSALEKSENQNREDRINPSELIGWHRSRYEEAGVLDLAGLGAYHWHTQSGYAGITLLFWDLQTNQFCCWSDVRPTFYQSHFNPVERFFQLGAWEGQQTIEQLSRSHFKLFSARRNRQNRLSMVNSKVILLEDTRVDQIHLKTFSNWQFLKEYADNVSAKGLQQYDFLKEVVVVTPTSWGEKSFVESTQEFLWPILDQNGCEVVIRVPFSKTTQEAIKNLENTDPEKMKIVSIVGRISKQLAFYPISFLCNSPQSVFSLGFTANRNKQLSVSTAKTNSEQQDTEQEQGFTVETRLSRKIEEFCYYLYEIAESGKLGNKLIEYREFFSSIKLQLLANKIDQLINSQNSPHFLLQTFYIATLCKQYLS